MNLQSWPAACAILVLPMLLGQVAMAQTTLYVAPTSQGAGDGGSPQNAANWRSAPLWNNVRDQLSHGEVVVQFAAGRYDEASINISNLGNADHHLIIRGAADGGTVFNPGPDPTAQVQEMVVFRGLQNATISSLHFTGPIQSYALRLRGSEARPSSEVIIENCSFKDLREIRYGAIGTARHVHRVTIRNNEFDNVGSGIHAHMIYNAHTTHHHTIEHNLFRDSTGDYIRFRDDGDHAVIRNNTFISTDSQFDRPFVAMPLFNSTPDHKETFATNYRIYGNVFQYFDRDTAWSPSLAASDAIVFSHYGYDPPGFNYLMTAEQGHILEHGSAQEIYRLLLENTGLDGEKIHISGNGYINVNRELLFGSFAHYGAESRGWRGFADISSIVNRTIP